jgi:hypothetical protein
LQISLGADLCVCPGGCPYTQSGADTQVRPYRLNGRASAPSRLDVQRQGFCDSLLYVADYRD